MTSRELIMEKLTQMFADARWELPSDFMEYSHFCRVVKGLDFTSSPGYPYLLRATNNAQLFGVVDGEPSEQALAEFWSLVRQRIEQQTADPIRLFVKPEPHKQKKLEQGRYRLISSVSVLDQIIDTMLFGPMNQMMIENYHFIPSKAGWTQLVGGWKVMPTDGWVALDKTMWDWTVRPWLIDMTLELRRRLLRGEDDRGWGALAQWRYTELFFHPWFVTSGGQMLRQKTPGVMKSGCVNTIADNSIMQVILHLRVTHELNLPVAPIMVMGDDTLQRLGVAMSDYIGELSQYCLVKQVVHAVEFAGHRFSSGAVEPLYKGKHAFTLLHLDPAYEEETLRSYVLLYHRSEWRDLIRGLMKVLGHEPPSVRLMDLIFDGC